ncbi:SGS3 [Culex quinquefasciatus]|uniref:SGS3 n=1 Tax=Culex quinquefasciatus TaxID=7176 RepID=B0XCM0_CULQU|nr:SGS3 [Culex quinquefasciatus]|eukprot:XP_001867392.1 SGS3 [Culex quinquefasciatus]
MERFLPADVQHLDDPGGPPMEVMSKILQIGGVRYQLLFVRSADAIRCYKYDPALQKWHHLWKKDNVFVETDEVKYCPWIVSEDGYVVVRNSTGIHIFKLNEQLRMELLSSDGRYHDVYNWNRSDHLLLFGHFYADTSKIGIISRNDRGEISFEAVIKEQALARSQQPIWKMDSDPLIGEHWKDSGTGVSLAFVDSSNQHAFTIRTSEKLEIFKFGKNHVVKKVLESNVIPFSTSNDDRVFYGMLYSDVNPVRDVLHFNSTGMTVYKYDKSSRNFVATFYGPQFSRKRGWTADHLGSVMLHDIDRDGIDELFYSGPSGLNIVRVSVNIDSSNALLSDKDMDVTNRHAKGVAVVDVDNRAIVVALGKISVASFTLQLNTKEETNLEQNVIEDSFEPEGATQPISQITDAPPLLVFDQFETDQATIDKLKDLFKQGVLQTHHNAVIVRSLSLQDSKLFLNLHFRIFSSNYELINQETVSLLIEDLNEYILELPPMQDNFFKVGYEKVNGKFKLKVKHHTGTVLDEVKRLKEQVEDEIRKHPHASESEKNKYRQESFDKLESDLQEVYKNVTAGIPFALDPAKFAEGLVSDLNSDCEGYPYTWVTYRDDPLEEKVATGLPGKPFSVDGPYSVKFGSNPSVSSIRNLFPTNKGFRHEFELNSGGSLTITVYDKSSNKVAELVKVINHDHRLTTFEYDSNNRLLRVLPPMYHFKAKTLSKADPFFDQKLTLAEIKMRDKWAKTYAYDAEGRLVEQSAPDSGTQRYLYTEEGLLRFIVNDSQDVTFYTYNSLGEIAEKGYLKITSEELPRYLANNSTLPKTNNFVVYDRGENELVSSIRHRVQKSRKNVEGLIVTEALHFDEKDQLLNKIFISANNSMAINYEYMNGRLTKINYPFGVNGKPLRVRYDYNVHGKIESVNMGGKTLASIQYTPHEQIKEIHFEPRSRFSYKRKFNYNAPGYLSSVRDNFLSETVDYISGSYGGKSFGDGTVSAVSFNSTWHSKSDVEFIKLEPKHFVSKDTSLEQASLCLNALENLGFLDDLRRPLKSFYPATELRMPLICGTGSRANHIAAVLTNEGFPTFYGHRYDYENHKQLIKAKYFQSSDEVTLDPLTQQSFSKLIPGLSVTDSKNVWDSLKSAGFIITDCSNSQTCHALPGKPLFHPTITQHINSASLEVLFAGAIKVRKDLPQSVFSAVCKIWHEHDLVNRDEFCDKVWKELLSQSFVGSRSNKSTKALNPELKAALKNHSRFLNEIVSTLYEHFAKGLGNSAGDIQSYDIDANGNHVHFYTGFKRYRLEYQENTNKISKIFCTDLATEEMREKEFAMEHDSEGSVTKATHKGIANISYDPLNKRVQQIDMIDGRQVFFQYDVRGERILKVVADHNGQILRQKYYIRDIKGKCLVDYEVTHSQNGATHVRSTAYIFSDNVMLGFVRDGQFYSVYSDHEGSIRLVIRNGEVVSAYDYLPYGQLLREYNTDPDAAIAYRYTGQEWDEETNLYNYHARLYDPEIGRFYQIDPKEQYPSPYVYAGNSPISLVDPDGQFAFLIPLAFAAVGGYLGASAANGSFNPTKWKLKPTLIGGVLGAVMGGLAPAGIGASFTFLTGTVGLSSVAAGFVIGTTAGGFAFLSAASANQNWNPLEWNWSDPATFNALFGGAVSGATLFAGIGNVHKRFISLAGTERIIFVASVVTSTAGVALYAGAIANDGNLNIFEWNWSSPDTIWKVTIGASFGMQVSTKLHEIESKIHGHLKDLKQLIKSGQSGDMKVFLSDAKSYFKQTHELLIEIQTTLIKNAKLIVRQPFLQLVSSSSKQSDEVIDAVKSILFEVSKYDGTQGIVTEFLQNLDDAKPSNRHSIEKHSYSFCKPIEFNGNASVVCDGKQSSLVFTPKPSGLGLDYINGCLMLAMVAPAAFSSIKNSILNFSARFSSKTRKTTPPLVENTNELIKRFDCLKGKLKTINSRNVRWINNVVEDLNEDILSFTKNGDVEDYTALLERLVAADEELTETIKVEHYRQMFDTSTNTTGPSFENNHTWASFQTFDIRREAIIEQLALECLDIMQ